MANFSDYRKLIIENQEPSQLRVTVLTWCLLVETGCDMCENDPQLEGTEKREAIPGLT